MWVHDRCYSETTPILNIIYRYGDYKIQTDNLTVFMLLYCSADTLWSLLVVVTTKPCTSDGADSLIASTPQVSDGTIGVTDERCIIER